MADKKVPRKVPPPKKTYPAPDEEERSEATQVSTDRFLHGKPTNPDGSVKE